MPLSPDEACSVDLALPHVPEDALVDAMGSVADHSLCAVWGALVWDVPWALPVGVCSAGWLVDVEWSSVTADGPLDCLAWVVRSSRGPDVVLCWGLVRRWVGRATDLGLVMAYNAWCTAVCMPRPTDWAGLAAREGPMPDGGHMDWAMLGDGDSSIVDGSRDSKASCRLLNLMHMS